MLARVRRAIPPRGHAGPTNPAPAAPDDAANGSVALVHDYLNQYGGAERVVLELAAIWPSASLYTALYRPESTFEGFRDLEIRTSFLDRLPVDRGFRNLLPLYPAAFRSFGTLDADVVVSSSSAWSHAVRTRPQSLHVVYCHTPARWLYGGAHIDAAVRHRMLGAVRPLLRRHDAAAARRPDAYVANSRVVRDRIARTYGREAEIVHPPVDVERFRPTPRGERLLVVARLLSYRRIDVIVDAATRAGLGLDIVGDGPELASLRARAGRTVEFHGRLSDADTTALFEGCRALCAPGLEDFGIAAVEANAAGKPVVAFAGGGALETLQEGVSGAFFSRHEPDAVLDAIARSDQIDASPEAIARLALRFSPDRFRTRMLEVVERAAARRGMDVGAC